MVSVATNRRQTMHTKGPWKVEKHSHINGELWLTVLSGAWDITHNGGKSAIADCRYSAMSDEENKANAKLIAAAPELLEALEAIAADYELFKSTGNNAALTLAAKAKAAIKKAKDGR